jgi:DNA polymerase I-like protein with 3'-5' exonuclease and polymerase domains
MLDSTPVPLGTVLTNKQRNILDQLNLAVSAIGIKINVNPTRKSYVGPTALDVEHDESGGFVGCGLSCGDGSVDYYSDLLLLRRIDFSSLDIIAHNGVSDIEILNEWGIQVPYSLLYFDTMLIAHILDSSQKDYSLKGLAKRELGIEYPSYDDIVGKRGLKAERITLDKQPLELVAKYNAMDVAVTYRLYERQKKTCENL